jgi:hypothetical protein
MHRVSLVKLGRCVSQPFLDTHRSPGSLARRLPLQRTRLEWFPAGVHCRCDAKGIATVVEDFTVVARIDDMISA